MGSSAAWAADEALVRVRVPDFEEDLSAQASSPKLPVLCWKWVLSWKADSTTHFAVTEAHSSPHVAMGRGILEGSQWEGDICSSWKVQEVVRI